MTLSKTLQRATVGALVAAGMTLGALAQSILTVDNSRVEEEAAAYRDFNLQTTEIRQEILQLRKYISRGGQVEQELAELENKKSIIGNDKYEEEKKRIEVTYVQAQQQLQVREYTFDKLRQEALVQVERARQPVLKKILTDRKAQIILPKRLAMETAPGLDVTTEFIELLDSELPAVTLTMPQKAAAAPAQDSGQ